MQEHWDLSGRDVVPDLRAMGRPADVGAAALHGMLSSVGTQWVAPYEEVRKALQIRSKQVAPELQEQANQRFRTYMALFRGIGLLYEESGVLQTTELGDSLLDLLNEQYKRIDDFSQQVYVTYRTQLAHMVAPALARYQLANPLTRDEYPPGTDIRPLLAIWRVMRRLDNKLHWEEMGRCLTTCLRESEIETAIGKITEARKQTNYDPSNFNAMEQLLGPRRPDRGDNQSDRLDTWFSRAAFKNLLLEPRDRPDGYRYLNPEFIPLLDETIEASSAPEQFTDRGEYVRWLGATSDKPSLIQSDSDDKLKNNIVEKCRRYGGRQIVALAGPAGTGKTRVAQEVAMTLTEGDVTRILTVQFHAAFTYEEFVGGLAPSNGGFKPSPGALVQINDAALASPEDTHVLIVDELSRADVANVLGELLTYIEYRNRPFLVPGLDRRVSIAPNLIIIATLNPADRSVVNMDDALVRRLRQIEIPPSRDALDVILQEAGMTKDLRGQVVQWFDSLPEDAPFGHGLFVGMRDELDLHDLWHESLRYFLRRGGITTYPNPEKIENGYVWRHARFSSVTEDEA
ncbi:McrB family protein [Streptomyces sp. NPDC057456]|uniref:McrB family protein n=1 Tax=Streptomyces sp. NPDC057456 TaxID=3346139 RepID=UPI0036C7EBEC